MEKTQSDGDNKSPLTLEKIKEGYVNIALQYGFSTLDGLTAGAATTLFREQGLEESEVNGLISGLANEFFSASIDYLKTFTQNDPRLHNLALIFEESITQYKSESGNVLRLPLIPPIVAKNLSLAALEILATYAQNTKLTDQDGNELEADKLSGNSTVGNIALDTRFNDQIVLMSDDNIQNIEGLYEDPKIFPFRDKGRVDLIFGYSDRYQQNGHETPVRVIEDAGFIYIPWTFINVAASKPLEALADLIEAASKVRDALTGQYDTEMSQLRAQSYRGRFLHFAIHEHSDQDLVSSLHKHSRQTLERYRADRKVVRGYKGNIITSVFPKSN